MADQPTRSGADGGPPAGDRSGRSGDGSPVEPLTVAELLARSGTGVRRRRAQRRESPDETGRQQPVGDGRPDRPPPRAGARRDLAPPPAVLPTGWQPAMPAPQAERPALPQPPTELSVTHTPARPRPTPQPQVAGPSPSAPSPSAPSPSAPLPSAPSPSAPSPVRGPATPPRPVPHPTPAAAPAPRVVPPVSVTPPPVSTPPAAVPAPPVPAGAPPVPPSPPAGTPRTAAPYQSVPVPGVRRSMPLPPIPGRDLPVPGADDPTTVTPLPRVPMSPGRRRLARAAVALVALVGLVAASYLGLYFYGDRALDRVDALVTDGPEILAPQLQESSRTYLIVGTGTPGRSGPAAVSTLIAHVSADDEHAVLVTVPPTALNDTPACRDSDGDVRPAATEPFAAALLDGGPSCLVRSVQQVTGLRVDHYVAVDLARLPGMVDALGDVEVCVADAAVGASSALTLRPGASRLTGEDVAGFLRSSGTGTDLNGAAATQRGQLVLTSALHSGLAVGALTDPLALTRFLGRAGDAVTVDADTTLGDLRALGSTLDELPGDAVERAALPVARVGYVPAGTDQAAVVVDATATRELFDGVIDAGRLPAAEAAAVPAAAGEAAGTVEAQPDPTLATPVPEGTVVTVAPAGVTVDVLDATGAGRTPEVADALAARGFRTGVRGVEPGAVDRTIVRYGPAALEPARTVAAAVPGAVLVETPEVGGSVQLVIGPDFAGLAPVAVGAPVPTTAAPAPVETGTGAEASCG